MNGELNVELNVAEVGERAERRSHVCVESTQTRFQPSNAAMWASRIWTMVLLRDIFRWMAIASIAWMSWTCMWIVN